MNEAVRPDVNTGAATFILELGLEAGTEKCPKKFRSVRTNTEARPGSHEETRIVMG